jgi:MscS family membrane protein
MEGFLDMTFLGIPAMRWIMAAAYMAGGFVVGVVASWICKNILGRIFAKTKMRIDDILLASIQGPLVAIIVFLGIRMGIDEMTVEPGVAPWINKAIVILIAFAVARALQKLLDGLIEEYLVPYVQKTEGNLDDQLLPILRKTANVVVYVIAAIFAIREAGYDIGALLAGLGIGGVAIALAAKDTLSNFFGSVSVFVDRPFMINDRVKVAGYDGMIVEIGIRTSRLKTLDNRIVTLPNSVFSAGAIENVSSEPSTKVASVVELDPSIGSVGAARAVEVLREVADARSGLEPGTIASLTGFGDSSYKFTYIVFVKKDADYFGTLNELNLEMLKRLEKEKLPLATPTRLLVGKGEGVAG